MSEKDDKTEKFFDAGKYINHFADEFLVVCPICEKQAKVIFAEAGQFNPANHLFVSRKLVCLHCGHSKTRTLTTRCSAKEGLINSLVIDGNFDWYFGLPLWLEIECCGKTLWAYNEKHLDFIENYVSALV